MPTHRFAVLVAMSVRLAIRLVTAVRADWRDGAPPPAPCIYFANHASHLDFGLLWAVLPAAIRPHVRPVAAADYWCGGPIRRFLAEQVFHAVLVERTRGASAGCPIELMADALDRGASLVLFPEGTRNDTNQPLLAFRSGLSRLLAVRPAVTCVPVWIANASSVLPKGAWLPVPLLCTVTFGAPLHLTGDDYASLAKRVEDAVRSLD